LLQEFAPEYRSPSREQSLAALLSVPSYAKPSSAHAATTNQNGHSSAREAKANVRTEFLSPSSECA
jgi:hypothetical protein